MQMSRGFQGVRGRGTICQDDGMPLFTRPSRGGDFMQEEATLVPVSAGERTFFTNKTFRNEKAGRYLEMWSGLERMGLRQEGMRCAALDSEQGLQRGLDGPLPSQRQEAAVRARFLFYFTYFTAEEKLIAL